jgi:hypothetical protein
VSFFPPQEIYYSDRQASGKRQRLDFGIAETPTLGDSLAAAFVTGSTVPFADVSLKCRERSFPCHKFMLSSR